MVSDGINRGNTIMATVTINILDSNGNVIEQKEIQDWQWEQSQTAGYNVQTLDSQPTTVQTITTEAQNILNKLESGNYQFPTWFNTNIEWLKAGKISSQDFINAYNHLDNDGLIIDLTQTPQTFNVTVYELDNNAQISSQNYPNATVEFQQNLISQNKLIYIGSHNSPSLEFVRNHYGYVEPAPEPTPTPEPDNSSFSSCILFLRVLIVVCIYPVACGWIRCVSMFTSSVRANIWSSFWFLFIVFFLIFVLFLP